MDYAVLPNSNEYGSPMKLFELMAMGVAVVAPDYAPVAEVINDGTRGGCSHADAPMSASNACSTSWLMRTSASASAWLHASTLSASVSGATMRNNC